MKKKTLIRIFYWLGGSLIGSCILVSVSLYFFKDTLIDALLQEANQHLKSKVRVKKIDLAFWGSFPNVSVDFHEIFVQDSYQGSTEKDTLLYSERIRLRFNLLDIWQKKYRLKRLDIYPGILNIKVNAEGATNYAIFHPSTDSVETTIDIDLQKITCTNLRIVYQNQEADFSFATHLQKTRLQGDFTEHIFSMKAKSEQVIEWIKRGKVNFVSNKDLHLDLALQVDQLTQKIEIPQTFIQIAGLPFELSGKISPDDTKIKILASQLELTDVVNHFTLPEFDQLTKYRGSGTANFALQIENKLEERAITCQFGIKNGQIQQDNIKLTNIQLKGEYTNNNKEDFLRFHTVHFQSDAGPFDASMTLSEFDAPKITGKANGTVDLAVLHRLFPLSQIDQIGGLATINGDIYIKIHDKKNIEWQESQAKIQLNEVFFNAEPIIQKIEDINGRIELASKHIKIDELKAKSGRSDVRLQGEITHIQDYWKKNARLKIHADIQSKFIDLNDWIDTNRQENSAELSLPQLPTWMDASLHLDVQELQGFDLKSKDIKAIIQLSDAQLNINTCQIKEINYQKHEIKNFIGRVLLTDNKLHIPQVQFEHTSGKISGELTLSYQNDTTYWINGLVQTDNIDIRKVFLEWDDFGQQTISHKHIEGNMKAKIAFHYPLRPGKELDLQQIKATMELELHKGRLSKVPLIEEIIQNLNTPATQLILGKEHVRYFAQQLEDIRFEELSNRIQIENGKITIPKMAILSSAIKLNLHGVHFFNEQIDYQFAFNLRDLKKKKTSEFGDIIDDQTGIQIYLRMYGTSQKPLFEWNKQAKRQDTKKYNEKEIKTIKEMLKQDFNLFKNEETIDKYEHKPRQKEILQIDYEPRDTTDKKEEKTGKIQQKIKQLEKEKKAAKQIEIEFD